MRALLVHQGLDVALRQALSSKNHGKIADEDLPDVLNRPNSATIPSLRDAVLKEVGGEKIIISPWKKLEDL